MSDNTVVEMLAAHAWVGAVSSSRTGVLSVRPAMRAMTLDQRPYALVGEYVQRWADLYDRAFESARLTDGVVTDFVGPGDPSLSEAQLRASIAHTVALVLEAGPQRVLEIGCGTGSLLERLHDRVDSYVGTDLSSYAVNRIQAARLPNTRAVLAGAHDMLSPEVQEAMTVTMGAGRRPDCVLINGVTQCFPGTEYLGAVIGDAIDLVEAGGRVILGDVRHRGLLTGVDGWRSTGEAELVEFLDGGEELLIDPLLIACLARASGRQVRISMRAKTMAGASELSRYWYDAVIQVDGDGVEPARDEVRWQDIPGDRLAALRALISAKRAVVTGIPNALLVSDPDAATGEALASAIEGTGFAVMVSLTCPTQFEIRPSTGHMPDFTTVPPHDEPLEKYAARRLPQVLRDYLAEVAPRVRQPEIVVDPRPA